MSRRARLTVLELGASPTAWASRRGLGADDWIVVAQQSDEPARDFSERVRSRARRLRREDAEIDAVDVYTAPHSDAPRSLARRGVIEALGDQMAEGGQLTLWSGAAEVDDDRELSAILAQFGPILAERQIAMNHQTCASEEPSGVRHAIPKAPATGFDSLADFDEID
jgi:hypothetical protein